ncbi:Na+/H+ antiporter subunit D [Aliihoeflea aestuarii]|jgi:multicomponent Na+:H+ antiporter subunit D|uniref:Na+/H+ antiporter subunit D n=1 Tax=Aliihoeflea aestuarii TaxID=453840 RepID=UPI0020921A35|nr:Na+/H+ antiporter subunit D [Aliihoeflea aestuarii]MCO6390157.1 Na+/H+ antiporter subunit D [Aliihoeflea aestuarii]
MTESAIDMLLLWPLAIPFATAAICAFAVSAPRIQRIAAAIGLAAMFVMSVLLVWAVFRDGILAMQFGSWAPPFGITFVADRFSASMVLVTAILAVGVAIFGISDIRRRQEKAGFYPLFMGLLTSVNGAFLTGDIFNLYVWFEVMLITALGLILLDRTRAQVDGAMKYLVLNLFATLLFLMAIALLYGVTGTLNMADLARVLPETEMSTALTISAMLFLIGFGTKAAFFPVFFWLPASYHAASIVVSALFAGLLTKVGVYACFRVFTLFFDVDATGIRPLMGWVAAGTMLFGVFGAAVQWDVRRILAFHIISQIGYILLGLAIATPLAFAGAIFYTIHHIIVKANLFLLAGAIYRATGTYDLRKAGGLMASRPLLAALFVIPALSLAGLPPFSGFWAKFMVIDASLQGGEALLAAVALFVGLMTTFSMSKIWMEAFWKPMPRSRKVRTTLPGLMLLPIGLLGTVTVFIGLNPEPLVAYSQAAAAELLDASGYIQAVLGQSGGAQ